MRCAALTSIATGSCGPRLPAPSCELRSPQCKGPLNGPKRRANTAPKAGALCTTRAAIHERESFGQRRIDLLHVGRSFDTFVLAGRADRDGQPQRCLLAPSTAASSRSACRIRGFYTKWMDGTHRDPNAGWKGRGLWTTVSTRTPFHMEGGKGTRPKVAHFSIEA